MQKKKGGVGYNKGKKQKSKPKSQILSKIPKMRKTKHLKNPIYQASKSN